MPVRWLPFLALLGSLALVADPAPSLRAQQPSSGPALILRLRPLDNLKSDVRYLIAQTGQEELAKQLEGMVKPLLARTGIDSSKPLGGYASVGAFGVDSTAVVMVPLADEKAFLAWLDSTGFTAQKAGGVYTLTKLLRGTDAYLRFANKYAYVSNDRQTLDEQKVLAPSAVFDPTDKSAASLTIRLGQVPKNIRDLFLQQLKAKLADTPKAPEETAAQEKFKLTSFEYFLQRAQAVADDGNELAIRLDIDAKAGALSAEIALSANAKTKLAGTIAEVGAAKSLFAGASGSDSALSFLINNSMTPELKAAFGPVVDEGIQKALSDDKLRPEYKVLTEKFLTALAPTLKSGDFDLAVTLRGTSQASKYSLLAAARVQDGASLEKSLRELVKLLKPEEQARIQLDAEKLGSVAIHKLDVRQDVAPKAREVFGDGPLYVAVRPDAFYFAFGANGLAVLKEALSAKPAAAPMFQFDVALSRFAPFIALDEGNKDVAKAAAIAFKNTGGDNIRITVEGGKVLRTRFSMKGDVIRFFAETARLKGFPIPGAN